MLGSEVVTAALNFRMCKRFGYRAWKAEIGMSLIYRHWVLIIAYPPRPSLPSPPLPWRHHHPDGASSSNREARVVPARGDCDSHPSFQILFHSYVKSK